MLTIVIGRYGGAPSATYQPKAPDDRGAEDGYDRCRRRGDSRRARPARPTMTIGAEIWRPGPLGMAAAENAMPDAVTLPDITTRRLFVATLVVDPIQVIGGPPGAGRRIGPVPGGHFSGERLRGTILPGGADWQTERGDGALLLDVRLVLRTDDDALIAMAYTGLRYGPADVIARLSRGEPVDPSDYYFRIFANFTTSAPPYEWLNRVQAIGVGHRLPEGPVYDMHELL